MPDRDVQPALASRGRDRRRAGSAARSVLVGMMGAGKSSDRPPAGGAARLPFVDADTEIEAAAGMSIPEIFETHGEAISATASARHRAPARRRPAVLATGGGAFINAETRAASATGVSIWLKADFDLLLQRVKRRSNRPLLKTADPGRGRRAARGAQSRLREADITCVPRRAARRDRRRSSTPSRLALRHAGEPPTDESATP